MLACRGKFHEISENKNAKKVNARTMKWREMENRGLFHDPELLVKRTRKGIPTSMRLKIWPELVKISKVMEKKTMSYSKVLIKDSMDIYDINLDIPRTFSFESQEILRESLFNVLKALSIEFPEIGYCQGMNFLTMRLLQVLDDDTTFYLMTYIIRKHNPICKHKINLDDNFRNPGFVTRQNAVYRKLLHSYMPKVESTLDQHNLDPVLYTPSWFLTLFSKSLPEEKFYRFFECFLLEGYSFLYKMVLAMVKLKEEEIIENTMEENFAFVPDMTFYDKIDDDILIETACKFDIDNDIIKKMEDDYNKMNKNEMEAFYKNCDESYERKKNNPRISYEWTLEEFSKTNSSLVKFDE